MSDRNHEKFEDLKLYVNKPVTVRFPAKTGDEYNDRNVILEKCTPNYVNLRRPEIKVQINPGTKPKETLLDFPDITVSVPLEYIAIAEDIVNKRPMLVFDHSFWERAERDAKPE